MKMKRLVFSLFFHLKKISRLFKPIKTRRCHTFCCFYTFRNMSFELLPNEILLDLFSYINGVDLLHAFYDLNLRFNTLLYEHRKYWFDFSSASKRTFESICQQHLSLVCQQTLAIELNDTDETREQTHLFFSYIPTLPQLTCLRSLTVCENHSYQFLLKLTRQCQYLSCLTTLKFLSCSLDDDDEDIDLQNLIDNIWKLSKLIECHIDIDTNEENFVIPRVISTSIRSLTIFPSDLQIHEIEQLFQCTPRLKYLSTYIGCLTQSIQPVTTFPNLVQLKLCFISSTIDFSSLNRFFSIMNNLRSLDVQLWSMMINGCQWKQIIRKHLPELRTFSIDMRISSNEDFIHTQVMATELIKTFQNSFWIFEHQWFVRCYTLNRKIYLKSLTNRSDFIEATIPDWYQSTYPYDTHERFYNTMTFVSKTFFDQTVPLDIRLSNIHSLHIKLPICDGFSTIFPNLDRIKSLTISSYSEMYSFQVENLLKQISNLDRLKICQEDPSLKLRLQNYTNTSVQHIDLYDCQHHFTNDECLILSRSSLFRHCQILSIRVKDTYGSVHFILNLFNIRILNIQNQKGESSTRWL